MNLLAGVKIVECAEAIQGPAAGCILADMGAEVIKIEPVHGDFLRELRSVMGVSMALPTGRNICFEAENRNKRSITLNLKSDEGRRILYQLVARADVFLTCYGKSVREGLGIEYETLLQHNPRLVYGTAGAYGERGPSATERAFDNVAFARSGMMHCVGEEGDKAYYMVPSAADELGGLMLALGLTAAIVRRDRTGQSQAIESSLLGSLMHFLTVPLAMYYIGGRVPKRPIRTHLFNPLIGWYKCADGRWLMLSLNHPQEEWHDFCEAVGLSSEVELDPKFNSIRARSENCEELIGMLDRLFVTQDIDYWLSRLRPRDLICSPVNRVEDVANDPQIIANDYMLDVDHPALGPIKMVALPIRANGVGTEVLSVAPETGQHTEEILLELDYSWDDIAALRDKGAL